MGKGIRKRRDRPAIVTLPVITGDPLVGETLTVTPGDWRGTPTPTIARQWKDDGVAISGATGTTRVLTGSQAGGMISVTETATNSAGSEVVTSASVGPVQAVTPDPVVDTQTLTFGALSLAGADGVAPINPSGAITSASIDSGDASNHFDISATGVITPTAAGDAANLSGSPYTLGCTFTNASGSTAATITVIAEANVYGFASLVELQAIMALGAAALSGKTAKGRAKESVGKLSVNIQPASAFTITSRDLANPFILGNNGNVISVSAAARVTIKGLHIKQLGASGRTIEIKNGSTAIIVEDCRVEGVPFDHTISHAGAPPTLAGAFGRDGSTASTNITIRNNIIRYFYTGIYLGHTITGNFIECIGVDFIKHQLNGTVLVADNFMRRGVHFDSAAHEDFIQVDGGQVAFTGSYHRNVCIRADGSTSLQGFFIATSLGNNDLSVKGNIIISDHAHGISIGSLVNSEFIGNTVASASGVNYLWISLGAGSGIVCKHNVANIATTACSNTTDNTIVPYASHAAAYTLTGVVGDLRSVGLDEDPLTARNQVIAALGIKPNGLLDKNSSGGASLGDHGATSGYVNWATTVPGSDGSFNAAYEA